VLKLNGLRLSCLDAIVFRVAQFKNQSVGLGLAFQSHFYTESLFQGNDIYVLACLAEAERQIGREIHICGGERHDIRGYIILREGEIRGHIVYFCFHFLVGGCRRVEVQCCYCRVTFRTVDIHGVYFHIGFCGIGFVQSVITLCIGFYYAVVFQIHNFFQREFFRSAARNAEVSAYGDGHVNVLGEVITVIHAGCEEERR